MEVKCRVCGKMGDRGKAFDPIMRPIPHNCMETEEWDDWMFEGMVESHEGVWVPSYICIGCLKEDLKARRDKEPL